MLAATDGDVRLCLAGAMLLASLLGVLPGAYTTPPGKNYVSSYFAMAVLAVLMVVVRVAAESKKVTPAGLWTSFRLPN